MKIITFINAARIFTEAAQIKVSPKLAYKIMKFCKSAAEDEKFYIEKRNEIISNYVKRDAEGQIITDDNGLIIIMEDKILEVNQALEALDELEIEIPPITYTIEELEELKLSVADMFTLEEFIKE